MDASIVSAKLPAANVPVHSNAAFKNENMSDRPAGRKISLAGNLGWAAAGSVTRLSAQLMCQMVLARLLLPADYGIFSIALIITTFASFLSEFGGSAALVKNKEISVLDIRINFTLQVLIGLFVTVALACSASLIAELLHKPDCAPVLRVLSLNCSLTMLSVVSQRLLARQMRFREIQSINIAGYLLGYVFIGIPMAYLHCGVWALVAAWFAQTGTTLLFSYALIRHNLVPYLSMGRVAAQIGFGIQTFVSGILTWGIVSVDRIVVARFNSPANLGLYTNAYNLASAPIWQIVSSLQQVLFSNASKDQNDTLRLQTSYRRSLIIVSTIAIPAFFTLALASAEVVFLVYGAKWVAAALVVTPLAMAMPFYAMNGVSTPVMWAKGRISLDVSTQAVTLGCLVAGLLLVSRLQMAAAAWVVLVTYIGRSLAVVHMTSRLLDDCVNLWRWMRHWLAVGTATLILQGLTLESARRFGVSAPAIVVLAGLLLSILLLAELYLLSKFGDSMEREFGHTVLRKLCSLLRKFGTRRGP